MNDLRPAPPIGWFKVAMPAEVAPDRILTRQRLGTQLVLWRDPRGDITCQEAWCPHAGASMAVGARLVDGCIECPFHAWRFDAQGWNRRTFQTAAPGRRARMRTFPVRVVGGIVFAWVDPYGGDPTWRLPEVPEVDDPAYLPYEVEERTVAGTSGPAVEVGREGQPVERVVVTTRTPIDGTTSRVAIHVAERRRATAGGTG